MSRSKKNRSAAVSSQVEENMESCAETLLIPESQPLAAMSFSAGATDDSSIDDSVVEDDVEEEPIPVPVTETISDEEPETEESESSEITENTTQRSSNMAITMSKYVDISSSFPEGSIADRSFGGLVFTPTDMLPGADATIKAAFDDGDRVGLSLSEVKDCFGPESYEYNFALGYYGYYSPSGTVASRLSMAKVMPRTIAAYEVNKAYAVGDYVKQSSKTYKCITAITAEANTGWEFVSGNFNEVSGTVFELPSEALERLVKKYDMFGSFTFLNGKGEGAKSFTDEELKGAATINSGYGAKFLFVINDVRGTQTASAIVAKKQEFNSATGTVYVCGSCEWSGYMPMAIFAATDFDAGTVTQHMFRQFSLTPDEYPVVQGDGEYDTFKNGGVNFYGRTQCNGVTFDFYQRGVNTNGIDTGVYCNEVWFKSACAKSLLQYLVGQARIPANNFGVEMVRTRVLEVCHSAQLNGAFMLKDVSSSDQQSIRNVVNTLGGTAQDVDNIVTDVSIQGYSVVASLGTKDGEYICHYWVFYGTGDSIKFIKGDDVMLK